MVVTDWMANKMHNLGYLQNFDQEAVKPAMDNLVPSLQSPSFDPDRTFSLPWQSGMTGLVVNTAEAPDVKSVNDLFDPQYKGQVEMLTEMRDTVPLVMKADGSTRPRRPRTTGWTRSTRSRRPPTQVRSASSPATTTPTTSPTAMRWR